MIRVHGNSDALRALYNKSGGQQSGPTPDERDTAEQFERLSKVKAWLHEHGHGGAIVLPLPLKILNSRNRHWAVTRKLKQQYMEACNLLLNARLLPEPPRRLPPHQTIVVQFHVSKFYDGSDNLNALMKWPNDWLKGKWCIDDADEYLTVRMLPQIIDRKCPRLEIRVL